MGYDTTGIVRDFDAADVNITAGGVTIATVPLEQKMAGVAVAIKNTGQNNPLTATVTFVESGTNATVPAPQTVTVAAGGLGYIYLPAAFCQPLPDSIIISATSAGGTTARVRVRATRGIYVI